MTISLRKQVAVYTDVSLYNGKRLPIRITTPNKVDKVKSSTCRALVGLDRMQLFWVERLRERFTARLCLIFC